MVGWKRFTSKNFEACYYWLLLSRIPHHFRYLSKVAPDEAARVTARCVLRAVVNHHYHIANATPVSTFGDEFHGVFPDGRVTPEFFTSLLMPNRLQPEVGRRIAQELIHWLPVLDVNMLRYRLDGEGLDPELFLECANMLDERRLSHANLEEVLIE